MTCHTGPSGRSTLGRVAPRFCAATGAARATASAAMPASSTAHVAALSNLGFIDFLQYFVVSLESLGHEFRVGPALLATRNSEPKLKHQGRAGYASPGMRPVLSPRLSRWMPYRSRRLNSMLEHLWTLSGKTI